MVNINQIQNKLIKVSQFWAQKRGFVPAQAQELRQEAIALNHAHYLKNIPIYQKVAQDEGIGETIDIETIKRKLMFSDGIFKSYNREWLDSCDFSKMNQWLSGIYHKPVNLDSQGVVSIDGWLEQLETTGITVTYSSGTSGTFSFVPRDKEDRALARTANTCYLAALLPNLDIGTSHSGFPLKQAVTALPPGALMKVINKTGLRDFDAFFLGFRRGKMGNQMLMQELATLFRKHYFLYDIDLTASALLSLKQGSQSESDKVLTEIFRETVFEQRDKNYARLLENINTSINERQKVFIFGAPYQFKELCEFISSHNKQLALNKGSLVLFGGGWKSFSGESMKREELVNSLADSFNLSPEHILEGYSMTETNVLTLRCSHGRFHIPPLIEPVIMDEEMNPLQGKDIRGTFGFLDPLAMSYPGFIISGDQVHMIDGECPCGLNGPALTEIGRSHSREIKGCGGIMGSVSA